MRVTLVVLLMSNIRTRKRNKLSEFRISINLVWTLTLKSRCWCKYVISILLIKNSYLIWSISEIPQFWGFWADPRTTIPALQIIWMLSFHDDNNLQYCIFCWINMYKWCETIFKQTKQTTVWTYNIISYRSELVILQA